MAECGRRYGFLARPPPTLAGSTELKANVLRHHPSPSREDIRKAISGNLCRCTGYESIVEAIYAASKAEPMIAVDGRPADQSDT